MRRKTGMLAAAGVVITLAAAACSSSSTTTNGGGGGNTNTPAFNAGVTGAVNASTHKGGTLTFDNSSAPDSTDAGNTYYAFNLNFTRLYATPLTTYKASTGSGGQEVVPGLATALGTATNNNQTWTYHLKS